MNQSFPNLETIRRQQLDRLKTLLDPVCRSNPFYRNKLEGSGIDHNLESLDYFSRNCPFTTKQELVDDQAAQPPYGSNLTFPIDRYTRFDRTSATTGAPMHWLDTPESWNELIGHWCEVFQAAGVDESDRVMFAFSFGPFLGFWTSFDAAQQIGCLCLPGGGMDSSSRLTMMHNNEATVLCCTPTYAIHLGEVAAARKDRQEPFRIRRIIVAGEPGGCIPAVRTRMESLWPGARVFDHHGMTETGPLTFECPENPGRLHVIEDACHPEIIDPQSESPVAEGDTGELVITTLRRTGSPVLRYRTGDLVRPLPVSQCSCGRWNLALDGGILGRIDDMITVRGVNVYPSAVDAVIRGFEEISEYRVVVEQQPSSCELKLSIESASADLDLDELCTKLEQALRETFTLRIPVNAVEPGSLPRFELKARRWHLNP
jgi:phenylacetate-CoA ligase